MDAVASKLSESDKQDILEEARERFEDINGRDHDNRKAAREDTEFVYVAGAQWPKKIKDERDETDEPALEFPQLKQFINQVVNDQRQNRPGIRVHPAGGKATEEVAKTKQGLIRHIEYDSQAEAVYDEGFKHGVVGGRGYWRVVTEYESAKTFNQKLVLKRVSDPNTVWSDIDFQDPDGGDKNWAIVTETVNKADFERRWPDCEPLSWKVSDNPLWYDGEDVVIIADYYRRVCAKRTLVINSDGASGYKDQMPALPEGVKTLAEREVEDYRVEWYKIAGGEQILEAVDWPGSIVPVVCCMGDENMVDGKRMFQGLIRQARDAQRMYNYEQSAKVARYALAPKAPFIAPAEAIADYEEIWRTANKKAYSTLPYNAFTEDGQPIPMPQRVMPAPMETGWIEAAQASKQDMRSVIGMYENSLGMKGQEVSGRAIVAREKQGDNATFHFVDNLSRAIALTGRILLELIPHYYDTQRTATIIGADDTRSTVTLNQKNPVDGSVENPMAGNDYAVTVEAGPSYATKREEESDFMAQMVQAYPAMMQFAGDLIVGMRDYDGADELKERFEAMLPPPIQSLLQAKKAGTDPQVAQLQGQLQQAQQQMQQMQQAMQKMQQDLEAKGAVEKAKLLDSQTKAELGGRSADLAELQLEVDTILQFLKLQQTQQQPIGPEAAGFQPEAHDLATGQPAMPPAPAAPMQIPQIMTTRGHQMNEAIGHIKNLAEALKAPRHMQVHFDDQGNVIGGTSTPIIH